MKTPKWPVLLIVFAGGFAAGAVFSPWRFAFISQTPSGASFLYRVDHLTGAAEVSIFGRAFKPIARESVPASLPAGWSAVNNP
jgi:hypothetical protein